MPNSSSVAIHFPVPHDVSKNNVARLITDEDHLVEYVSKGFQGEGAGERKYIYFTKCELTMYDCLYPIKLIIK